MTSRNRRRFLAALLVLMPCTTAVAVSRFPGESWMMFKTPEQAGFSAEKLAEAKKYWESIPSAALLVVRDGAVVVAWGDVDRRFMCHSVRKSFMSGLYGIHVDKGDIDVEKTLEQLGIDDEPPLSAEEKQARIIDLLRARSGVYRLAAYEPPQNPKPPRGSHAPGTFWCYNNWDFNTLCTILEQVTGVKVFEDFKKCFADPLGMQDFRLRDGYYHYERDKSIHPAYPFRMSARDMARFGLLYLAKGNWNGRQILSEKWVEESTRAFSEGSLALAYGYLWWVPKLEPFKELGTYCALGVGEQAIDVIPGANMVVVNRANTYADEEVSGQQHLQLLHLILDARTSEPSAQPELVPLPTTARKQPAVEMSAEQKQALCDASKESKDGRIILEDGELVVVTPHGEKFGVVPLGEDKFMLEDACTELFIEREKDGSIKRLITESGLNDEGYALLQAGKVDEAIRAFKQAVKYYPQSANAYDSLGEAYAAKGDKKLAIRNYRKSLKLNPDNANAKHMLEQLQAQKTD